MISIIIQDFKSGDKKEYYVSKRIAKAIDLLLVHDDKVFWKTQKGNKVDGNK